MYIPGELIILILPIIIGILTGKVVWDSKTRQFTMKEKSSRETGLKKIDGNYIISKKVKIND